MPVSNHTSPSQIIEMHRQFISQRFVFIDVRQEDVHRHRVVSLFLYLDIENLLDKEAHFKLPSKQRIKTMDDVEEAALNVREKWRLGFDLIESNPSFCKCPTRTPSSSGTELHEPNGTLLLELGLDQGEFTSNQIIDQFATFLFRTLINV